MLHPECSSCRRFLFSEFYDLHSAHYFCIHCWRTFCCQNVNKLADREAIIQYCKFIRCMRKAAHFNGVYGFQRMLDNRSRILNFTLVNLHITVRRNQRPRVGNVAGRHVSMTDVLVHHSVYLPSTIKQLNGSTSKIIINLLADCVNM